MSAAPHAAHQPQQLTRGQPRVAAALRRARASLASQVLVLFLFATLAPLTVALWQLRADALSARQRVYDNSRAMARGAAAEVEFSIDSARRTARTIAQWPAFRDVTDA